MKAVDRLRSALTGRGLRFVTAESLTAGLAASMVAESSGASSLLWGGFICYSDDAKIKLLGVDPKLLALGAVSREVSEAMSEGALRESGADLSVAITGLAGPNGDGSSVAVGTVWISTSLIGEGPRSFMRVYSGDRGYVRQKAAEDALEAAAARLT